LEETGRKGVLNGGRSISKDDDGVFGWFLRFWYEEFSTFLKIVVIFNGHIKYNF